MPAAIATTAVTPSVSSHQPQQTGTLSKGSLRSFSHLKANRTRKTEQQTFLSSFLQKACRKTQERAWCWHQSYFKHSDLRKSHGMLTSWQQDGAGLTTWCLELSQAGATQGSLDVFPFQKFYTATSTKWHSSACCSSQPSLKLTQC